MDYIIILLYYYWIILYYFNLFAYQWSERKGTQASEPQLFISSLNRYQSLIDIQNCLQKTFLMFKNRSQFLRNPTLS